VRAMYEGALTRRARSSDSTGAGVAGFDNDGGLAADGGGVSR